ncbi:MAG: hypothetical protein B7Z73_11515 [Planctomycetia bacterium 21-64-5]|nr:MAG: hypothetical protein B7Z73_11515 [Planctomycetia bacterium 21-64-5]
MPTTKRRIRFFVLIGACLTVGCEPPPPKPQDLGRIVYNPAEVPGADQPYALPEHLRNIKPEHPEHPEEGRPPGE